MKRGFTLRATPANPEGSSECGGQGLWVAQGPAEAAESVRAGAQLHVRLALRPPPGTDTAQQLCWAGV